MKGHKVFVAWGPLTHVPRSFFSDGQVCPRHTTRVVAARRFADNPHLPDIAVALEKTGLHVLHPTRGRPSVLVFDPPPAARLPRFVEIELQDS